MFLGIAKFRKYFKIYAIYLRCNWELETKFQILAGIIYRCKLLKLDNINFTNVIDIDPLQINFTL